MWEREDGIYNSLTPWGAEQLGVRLVDVAGDQELQRWAPIAEADPDPPRARGVCDALVADLFVDESPGPAAIAEARDELAQLVMPYKTGKLKPVKESPLPRMVITGGLPWPLVLLGSSRLEWSELAPGADPRTCPDCHGRPLGEMEYCLGCDRWGLNWFRADDSRFSVRGAMAPRKKRKRRADPAHLKNLERIRRRREKELRRAKHARRRCA